MFLSRRERNLWSLAAAVVAIIFLALFVGPALVGAINETVMVVFFAVGMILVAISVLTQGLQVRPAGIEAGVVLGVLAIFVLLAVRLTLPERSHLLEFGVLTVLVYEALIERNKHGHATNFPTVWTIFLCVSVGLIDEGLQYVIPDRVFDTEDMVFNLLAVSTAAIGMALLQRVRLKFANKS